MYMRLQQEKTGRKAARPLAADVPERAHGTTEEALHDLRLFIIGQEHMPDVPLQLEDINQDLNRIVDDEVVASLEQMFEDAVFAPSASQHDELMLGYLPAYQLLKKLRDLQKTRLRDAIERTTARRKS